jgi:hypothetical protein
VLWKLNFLCLLEERTRIDGVRERVPRLILEPKREKITGGWGESLSEEYYTVAS